MHELLPDGITDLRDAPHTLFEAIRLAMVVLSFDELEDGERPPRHIWLDGERMNDWFSEIRRRRKEKYSGGNAGSGEIEDPVQNQAARDLIVG